MGHFVISALVRCVCLWCCEHSVAPSTDNMCTICTDVCIIESTCCVCSVRMSGAHACICFAYTFALGGRTAIRPVVYGLLGYNYVISSAANVVAPVTSKQRRRRCRHQQQQQQQQQDAECGCLSVRSVLPVCVSIFRTVIQTHLHAHSEHTPSPHPPSTSSSSSTILTQAYHKCFGMCARVYSARLCARVFVYVHYRNVKCDTMPRARAHTSRMCVLCVSMSRARTRLSMHACTPSNTHSRSIKHQENRRKLARTNRAARH